MKVSTLVADVIATCEKVEFYGLKIANDKKKNGFFSSINKKFLSHYIILL